MKKLIAGLILGSGLMFLTLWALGFRKHQDEWSLAERQLQTIKGDIMWFARLDGYPKLVYKDPALISALKVPDRVLVYRITEDGESVVAGYGLTSATEASEKDREYFSTVVCSPTSMTGVSACLFSPGFAIRFDKGDDSFYALVCYSCSDIFFFDAAGNHVSGWGMTYEAAFALIHRFYELFPNDSEVQAIKF